MKPNHLLALVSVLTFASLPKASAADAVMDMMPGVFDRAAEQTTMLLKSLGDSEEFPRSIKADGSLRTVNKEDWTSGFFPGTLWFLYEYTGSDTWKNPAIETTRRLESLRHFSGHHDVGFMLTCSYGNALRFDPSDNLDASAVLRDGAAALATRFHAEPGLIRSWDFGDYKYPVIIDNMMNLELLMWAADHDGDPKLREIAISHADHTLANHFRPDGSAYHVLDYDPETGHVIRIDSRQGMDVRTPWARGQGWAIYGFSMMHRETGKQAYLDKAVEVADLVMNHPNLPADKVPYWDFGAKPGDDTPRDASAAAVMASALIELSQALGPEKGAKYLDFARAQLLSLGSPAYLAEKGTNGGFLLMHSTGSMPENSEVDVPLNYADYYFLEALLRYRALMAAETGENPDSDP